MIPELKIKEVPQLDPKSVEAGYNMHKKEVLEILDKMPKLLWRDDLVKELE